MSDWSMRRGTNFEELYYVNRLIVLFPKDDPLYHKLFVAADMHDELLAALKALYETYPSENPYQGKAELMAKAVIAKAEGRA